MNKGEKRPELIILTLLFSVSFIISVTNGPFLFIKIGFLIYKPFLTAANSIQNKVNYSVQLLKSKEKFYQQNMSLREKNRLLIKKNSIYKSLMAELKQIQRERQSGISEEYQSINAKVIARTRFNWFESIIIDVGRNKGLKKGVPVTCAGNLVGLIEDVYYNSASVKLITNPDFVIDVMMLNSRIVGLAEGAGKNSLNFVFEFHKLNIKDAGVKELVGESVVTAGLMYEDIPKNINLGILQEIIDEKGLVNYAIIKPIIDLNDLEYVNIIIPVERAQ